MADDKKRAEEESKQEPPGVAAAVTQSPESSESTDGSSGSSGNGNRFYTLFESIQKNIEGLNAQTKEIEKINDRILFQASTITTEEESSLIHKVSKLHKYTSMKARDTSRLIKNLRVETAKPTPAHGSESKTADEKSEEEKAEESRDVGDKENICRNITRSFTDELLLYQSAIQDFKNELKERLTKKVQSFRPKASEDFIDLSLRSESSRYALFREIMAADEKDLSEEDAKAMKDEIAEKYVVIAELSTGASEMNKIFLDLASSSTTASATTPRGMSLSDSDEDDENRKLPTSRTSRFMGPNTRTGRSNAAAVDELLGSLNLTGDPRSSMASSGGGRSSELRERRPSSTTTGMDESGRSTSSKDSQGKNRLFQFMKRHRRASTNTAKKLRFDTSDIPRKPRANRGSRWMTLFLLATVALAALIGIVILH